MKAEDPRPLLCWEERHKTTGLWLKSDDNPYWRPTIPHYPDTRLLQTGDILLFKPSKPSLIQKAIQNYEAGSFTHAAVYLQADNDICEASFKAGKVICSSLEDLLEGNCLLARRCKGIDSRGQAEIAAMATSLLQHPYNLWPLVTKVFERVKTIKQALKDPEYINAPLICSTLCEHAILAANLGARSVTRRNGHAVMPEDLASTDILEDIPLTWKAAR